MPDRCAGSGGGRLEKLAAGIGRFAPAPLAFAECPEAEPANDSPGRALRYAVSFRGASGRIKGGPAAARRMPGFAARVPARRARGRGAAAEAAKLNQAAPRPRTAPARGGGGADLTQGPA